MTAVEALPPWVQLDRLPNAGPLRAVDRVQVTARDGGLTVVAWVAVDPAEQNMRGHFPGRPIYPGVFVVETLCQAARITLGGQARLRRLSSLRLLAPVLGGDELALTVELTERDGGAWDVKAVGRRRDGTVTAQLRAAFDSTGLPATPADPLLADPLPPGLDAGGDARISAPMNAAQIRAALPQRYPLLLVDQVVSRQKGVSIETAKAITATEPCYAHLDDDAAHDDYAYPLSLLIESFGQSACLLWLDEAAGVAADPARDDVLLFLGARDYTVHGHAYPGDLLRHVVRLDQVVADTAFASGETWAGDRRIATVGTLLAARRPAGAIVTGGQPSPPTSPVRNVPEEHSGRIPQPSQ